MATNYNSPIVFPTTAGYKFGGWRILQVHVLDITLVFFKYRYLIIKVDTRFDDARMPSGVLPEKGERGYSILNELKGI